MISRVCDVCQEDKPIIQYKQIPKTKLFATTCKKCNRILSKWFLWEENIKKHGKIELIIHRKHVILNGTKYENFLNYYYTLPKDLPMVDYLSHYRCFFMIKNLENYTKIMEIVE